MTTYDYPHVGSMRGPVFFDVVRRFLSAVGYEVVFVQNFTDVDDKTIARAAEAGIENALELSARFNREYYRDLFALGVKDAEYFPKVTGHIGPIIDYIKVILDKGYAYVSEGNVYFSVKDFPNYLKLSRRNLDDLREETRQTDEVGKRDPLDFALWKAQKPGEPAWDSPWGPGRPGWHIECSVMSTEYLGETFDIHGGGQELKFPHHENEIAQAEAHSGEGTFARIWMHYEWVTFKGGKMAKSGEFFRMRDILKEYEPEMVRMFLLSSHWRKKVDFSREKFDEMRTARKRLVTSVDAAIDKLGWRTEEREENLLDAISGRSDPLVTAADKIMGGFVEHMSNDFNTQGATASMFEMTNQVNHLVAHYDEPMRIGLNWSLMKLMQMADIIGILQDKWHKVYYLEDAPVTGADVAIAERAEKMAAILVELRDKFRAEKMFDKADMIRDRLAELGAEVQDTPDGTKLKWD
jgi:cysteinyl-tRNA synthetase